MNGLGPTGITETPARDKNMPIATRIAPRESGLGERLSFFGATTLGANSTDQTPQEFMKRGTEQ
jgi:hypothetical protein